MIHALFTEGRVRLGRLAEATNGLDTLADAVSPFSPEAVAERAGIAASVIRDLAREFVTAPSAVAYGRVGTCTQEFGGLASWLVTALNLVTGNLDRPGGAMFPTPAADLVALADRIGQRGHFDKGRSRVRGLPEFGGEWPVAVLAEEIETEGPGQIRALVTSAGNPVLSTPNGARLDRALSRLDYMVSIDLYLNETTRHAHLILPPTFALERSHYDLVFHALAVRNTAKYSRPLFPAPRDGRHDWQILLELAMRLEAARDGKRFGPWLKSGLYSLLGPDGILALLLRIGSHGAGFIPFAKGLTLRKLRREPHGIDLGPLQPVLPDRLFTKTRRIELSPPPFVDDLKRLLLPGNVSANGELTLIGRRDLRSNNSWMHNCERLVKGRERCTLIMHPRDAEARGVRDGQRVRVATRAGSVRTTLEVSEEIRPGVVSLPHGWGHERPGARLRVASARPGVSLNDLTDETLVDPLSGTSRLNGVPVRVEAEAPETA
jgi:anaerobic selenocysteine-containing dehydrogenase